MPTRPVGKINLLHQARGFIALAACQRRLFSLYFRRHYRHMIYFCAVVCWNLLIYVFLSDTVDRCRSVSCTQPGQQHEHYSFHTGVWRNVLLLDFLVFCSLYNLTTQRYSFCPYCKNSCLTRAYFSYTAALTVTVEQQSRLQLM